MTTDSVLSYDIYKNYIKISNFMLKKNYAFL